LFALGERLSWKPELGRFQLKVKMSETFDRKVATPAEREARKAFRQIEAEKAMTDHERQQKAFHENRERLKVERLAREAEAKGT